MQFQSLPFQKLSWVKFRKLIWNQISGETHGKNSFYKSYGFIWIKLTQNGYIHIPGKISGLRRKNPQRLRLLGKQTSPPMAHLWGPIKGYQLNHTLCFPQGVGSRQTSAKYGHWKTKKLQKQHKLNIMPFNRLKLNSDKQTQMKERKKKTTAKQTNKPNKQTKQTNKHTQTKHHHLLEDDHLKTASALQSSSAWVSKTWIDIDRRCVDLQVLRGHGKDLGACRNDSVGTLETTFL